MSTTQGKDLEALKREFQESKAKVWANRSLPWSEQQAEIDRLWQEFNRRRNELEGSAPQGVDREGGGFQHPVFSKRRRRGGHLSF